MIPNYAYWGLPNYTKFINNHTPVVPPQPNITPAQVQSSVVPPQPNASRVQNYVSGARSFNASSQPYIVSAQAYANFPKFSAMPTYAHETPDYRSKSNYRNFYANNNYDSRCPSTDKSNNKIDNLKNTDSNRSESGNYEPVFNLLGINLYFDDILILCLLFFLYTEQANDFSLYLALIFLLMC